MKTLIINIDPIIEYIEEGLACYGDEHPGWNAIAESVHLALETWAETHDEPFDVDNNLHFSFVADEAAMILA